MRATPDGGFAAALGPERSKKKVIIPINIDRTIKNAEHGVDYISPGRPHPGEIWRQACPT